MRPLHHFWYVQVTGRQRSTLVRPSVDNMAGLLTTTELAGELHLSVKTIQRYQRDGKLHPKFTLPSGQHRWDLEDVLEQLRALRPRPD